MDKESTAQLDPTRIICDGFVYAEDPAIGQAVEGMRNRGFPLKTTSDGLKFCREKLLEDKRVQFVLKAFYSAPCLGVYHWYSCDPEQTYLFTKSEGRDPQAVVVHLFTPETTILVFEGSQSKVFKTWHAPNGMLVVSNAALRRAGMKERVLELQNGGLVIADTRLSFRILKGHAIIGIYADKNGEELQKWDKIGVKREPALEDEVAAMDGSDIYTNFTFI